MYYFVSLSAGPEEEAVGAVSIQKFQENVFVEGDRPKYVLDLHTEAQQGLKLQQQEGKKNQTPNQILPFALPQIHAAYSSSFYWVK